MGGHFIGLDTASFGDSQMEQLVSHMKTLYELNQKEYKENRRNKNERGIITGSGGQASGSAGLVDGTNFLKG